MQHHLSVGHALNEADHLIRAIEAKSRSRAQNHAHRLLCALPNPTWAETAPGLTIYHGNQQELAQKIEILRYSALTWLRALIDPTKDWEPSAEWPRPENLIEATRELEICTASECIYLEEDGSVAVIK